MSNARNKQEFVSPIFEMAKLKWDLVAFPNGRDNDAEGSFNLFLRMKEMPHEWNNVHTYWVLRCPQTKARESRLVNPYYN